MLRMYLIQCIPIPCDLTLIMIKRSTVTVNNLLYTCVCCNNTLYRIRTFNRLYSCNLSSSVYILLLLSLRVSDIALNAVIVAVRLTISAGNKPSSKKNSQIYAYCPPVICIYFIKKCADAQSVSAHF